MIRQLKQGGSFYYQFILDGKRYNGVCKNCSTKKDAEAYERKIKREAARGDGQTEAEQYHRVELKKILRSKNQILMDEAFELAEKKPRKRIPAAKKLELKRGVWRDFLAFMHGEYPEITSMADVEKNTLKVTSATCGIQGGTTKSFSTAVHIQANVSANSKQSLTGHERQNNFLLAPSIFIRLLVLRCSPC